MLSRVLGAVVLLKALDVALRGPVTPLLLAGLPALVAGGLWLVVRPSRPAWALVALAGAVLAADAPVELRRQHLVLLIGLAVAAAVARTAAEQRLLWRTQLTVLYAVAALAKLNETFLGDDVLATALIAGPLELLPPPGVLVALGVALVAAEAALAVLLWVRPRAALPLAGALHASALLAAADPDVALRLVVFGGAAVAAVAAVRASD